MLELVSEYKVNQLGKDRAHNTPDGKRDRFYRASAQRGFYNVGSIVPGTVGNLHFDDAPRCGCIAINKTLAFKSVKKKLIRQWEFVAGKVARFFKGYKSCPEFILVFIKHVHTNSLSQTRQLAAAGNPTIFPQKLEDAPAAATWRTGGLQWIT